MNNDAKTSKNLGLKYSLVLLTMENYFHSAVRSNTQVERNELESRYEGLLIVNRPNLCILRRSSRSQLGGEHITGFSVSVRCLFLRNWVIGGIRFCKTIGTIIIVGAHC